MEQARKLQKKVIERWEEEDIPFNEREVEGLQDYVIGIDQSYTRTGITVLKNKEVVEMFSLEYEYCNNNSEKRTALENTLNEIMIDHDIANPLVITERIRLRSQGFLSEAYIKSTGALIAIIIDFFHYYNEIPVYSVDTRSWKSQIIGSSKPLDNPYGINPEKYRTICYLRDRGLLKYIVKEYKGKGKKGIIDVKMEVTEGGKKVKKKVPCEINDDLADSYCIALYGYLPKTKQKLKKEKF